MANSIRQKSSTKTMLIMMVFLGIAAGYIFYFQTLKDQALSIAPMPIRTGDDLTKLKDKKLNLTVFNNNIYKTLRIFGEVPVDPGIVGKENLFDLISVPEEALQPSPQPEESAPPETTPQAQ